LSLAQLGGSELTRAAIHRIETGKSRPSRRSLRLIAERTNKPLTFFLAKTGSRPLAPEVALARLTVEGKFDEVVKIGRRLLEEGAVAGHAAAVVHYWLGEALVRLVRPEEALESLEIALVELDKGADPWLFAHALHMKSGALYLLDDPESQFVAEEALRRSRQLDPKAPMLEARVLNHLAAVAVNRQEWTQAIRYYDRALAAAEPLRNLRQLSLMHEGLGMAYHHLGHATQAADHFSRSLALYSLQSDLSSMARAEVNLSELLMTEGRLASAEEHISQSLRYCEEDGVDRRNRTYAMVNLAKLRLRQGRTEEVERLTAATIELSEERGERLSLATAHQVRGQYLLREGRSDEADASYLQAIGLFVALNLIDRVRSCRIEYATELDAQGRSEAARDQWKLAALAGRDSHDRLAERLSAQA
jgi:tetratricopeptide (TPR) repeat protein